MTHSTLPDRLLAEADFTRQLFPVAIGPDLAHLKARESMLREAAAALSAPESLEAVAFCRRCGGSGIDSTGTDESPTTVCDGCGGRGYITTPQPGDGWRPIAEAPKDGGDFLVFLPNERRKIQCAWQNENGIMAIGSCFSFDLSPATHWMPLPAAPSAEGG